MLIEQADIDDAEAILELQKLAFREQALIYGDFALPALTESPEQIKADFSQKLFLKVQLGGKIAGAVRAFLDGQTCFVERLVVAPEFQNQGIGTGLMFELERIFSEASRFELFTGHKSEKNLHLYGRLGYSEFRRERYSDVTMLVFMEKVRTPY